MTNHGDQHALSNFVHSPPILGTQWDSRQYDAGENVSVTVKNYMNTLYDSRWLIGVMTGLFFLLALFYVSIIHPVYETNLVMHVKEDSAGVPSNPPDHPSYPSDAGNDVVAAMELIRSRMIVAPVVDKLQLFIDVQPKYFPIGASWFARQSAATLSTPGVFGYGGYVWGSECAELSVFNVPDAWLHREFVLTPTGHQRYRLSGGAQHLVFEGTVGDHYAVPTPEGMLEIQVDRLQANPGAVFYVTRQSRLAAIEALQHAMVMTEQGARSGMIEVKLQGENARRITAVLSAIAQEYVRQNRTQKNEEVEKSLAYVNQQLPILKRQLENAEDSYHRFHNIHGTVNLHEEASMILQQAAAARARRIELVQKKTELMARFTEDHPVVAAVSRQRQEVDAEIEELAGRIKALPMLEQEEAQLTRDIKANTDLYSAMSNTAQQVRLSSVSRVSNVRIIDAPMEPEFPLTPNRLLVVLFAGVTGMFIGVLTAFARKAITGGIDEPQKIERLLHARVVYATIPHSVSQDKLAHKARGSRGSTALLAQTVPEDPAVESLRSFRTALQFSMPHFKNNIVMFAGATGNLGKSFITANFAAVMAASGKRVLLIDADLRKGQLHRHFGVARHSGLSTAMSGAMPVSETIHRDVLDHLDFISTGALPSNAADCLLHLNFGNILDGLCPHYDLVLIDQPPILDVADMLIIGAHAGSVFLVARSGVTTENEINESIKRLNQAGISPQGVLFNDVSARLTLSSSYAQSGALTRLRLAG